MALLTGLVLSALLVATSAYSLPSKLSGSSRLSTTLFMEKLTHSQFYNQVRSSIAEIEAESPYTVEELEELKKLIDSSILRKSTAKSKSNSLHELCEITKEAVSFVLSLSTYTLSLHTLSRTSLLSITVRYCDTNASSFLRQDH